MEIHLLNHHLQFAVRESLLLDNTLRNLNAEWKRPGGKKDLDKLRKICGKLWLQQEIREDLTAQVSTKVADFKTQHQEYKQQPEVTHTLRKKLYFFPQAAADQNP
ncbi:uncharacterized protein LOC144885212 [Branchiostoma floridae x Branchiostoma japonicum]